MSKIVSTKRSSAIFLATVLVLGTFAAISPSFMLGAQAEPYYGMDDRYDSYEPDYSDRDNYEPTEYPSYKPEYPSDNSYKSKDSSNTIVKKIKCNNINSNINGVDVNLGIQFNDLAEAQAADNEGQETTANGLYGERNGYKQNDNDFKFVCINNNDNENNVGVEPPTPEPTITCEECFTENLTPQQLENFDSAFQFAFNIRDITFELIPLLNFERICILFTLLSEEQIIDNIEEIFLTYNANFQSDPIPQSVIDEIISCVLEALNIDTNDISEGLTTSNINTDTSAFDINTAGSLASSFSSQPTIAQETEASSSALEKTTKLKQQWLDLLP